MGYMALERVAYSDNASDLAHIVFKRVVEELDKGLKEKGNEYNTSGCVNVALFVEQFLDHKEYWDEDMLDVIERSKIGLELLIEGCKDKEAWPDEQNRKHHVKSYKRMVKALDKFLNKIE